MPSSSVPERLRARQAERQRRVHVEMGIDEGRREQAAAARRWSGRPPPAGAARPLRCVRPGHRCRYRVGRRQGWRCARSGRAWAWLSPSHGLAGIRSKTKATPPARRLLRQLPCRWHVACCGPANPLQGAARCPRLRFLSSIFRLTEAGDAAARRALAAEVDRTCREIGFMVISGHGVDPGPDRGRRETSAGPSSTCRSRRRCGSCGPRPT